MNLSFITSRPGRKPRRQIFSWRGPFTYCVYKWWCYFNIADWLLFSHIHQNRILKYTDSHVILLACTVLASQEWQWGHVETVSSPNHTFFLGKLEQAVFHAHTFTCNMLGKLCTQPYMLVLFNPFKTNGIFHKVWFSQVRIVHYIYLGMTGYNILKILFSEDRFCLSKQCRPWCNALGFQCLPKYPFRGFWT